MCGKLRHYTKIISAYLFLLQACQSSSHKQSVADTLEPGTIRIVSFQRDSTVSAKGIVPRAMNFAKHLGLRELTGRYPGLYIRIWAWDSSNTQWIIDLKKNRTGSACSIMSYTTGEKDGIEHIYIHDQRQVSPKAGWEIFYQTLQKFNIPEMPSDKLSVEEKTDYTSLNFVRFEIDQPNGYRLIEYPDPAIFSKQDSACRLVNEFFLYFNDQMSTHLLSKKFLYNR